jgi:hypothetical protein
VCGAQASVLSRITLSSRGQNYLNRAWDPYYTSSPYGHVRQKLPQPKLRVIPIFVCEEHYHSDTGFERHKICCFIVDGFTIAFFFFGLLFLGDAFNRSRPIPFWSIVFSVFFAISMLFTWIAFRPNALQRAVQIIGFDQGLQNVLLVFKDKSYRDLVIHDNPMSTELVSWIVKPAS